MYQKLMGQSTNPYLYETLKAMVGQPVAVQLSAMQVQQGILRAVLPDHIVLLVCQVPFFIRMDEIVWVTVLSARKK